MSTHRNSDIFSYIARKHRQACRGILKEKIDEFFSVRDVCMGSGNAREAEYYMALGTVKDDEYGTGVILTMLSEIISLFWN